MAVQSVGAANSVSDEMVSTGNIEYDVDADGAADILFYSKDLTTIATGIDSLNTNIATLQQSFVTLSNTTAQYKTNIINSLNSNIFLKANIPTDATFEQIIQSINNIPAPTVATGNVWPSGDNTGVGITSNGQSVNIDGVTNLNLAVNESVTLPSGYYPSDITVSNNVINRGTVSFSPSGKQSITLQAGYYTGGTLDSTSAYNQGYNQGVTDADARANPSSTNYQTGYNQGVANADARSNPSSANYQAGYNAGKNAATLSQTRLATPSGYSRWETTYTFSYTCPKPGVISCYSTNQYEGTGYITLNGVTQASGQTFSATFVVNAGDSIYYAHNYGSLSGWINYAYIN